MKSKQGSRNIPRSYVFLTFSILIILFGGISTLLWQERQNTQAYSDYVVGPPTLPAALVNQIFARMGSPMVGTGGVVEAAARRADIDDAFALGVWYAETNDGMAGVGLGDRNPGSVKGSAGYPAAYDGYTIYPSYAVAIQDWFALIRSRYVNRGLTTIYSIAGPYVGTAGASIWAGRVNNLMFQYHNEAPPMPAHTPKPTPVPTPLIRDKVVIRSEPASIHHEPDGVKESRPTIQASPQDSPQQVVTHAQPPVLLTPTAEHIYSTSAQILILGIILSSILIALLVWIIRRCGAVSEIIPAISRSTTEALAQLDIPSLYANKYSPALRQENAASSEITQILKSLVQAPHTPVLLSIGIAPPTPMIARANGVPPTPMLPKAGTIPFTPFLATAGSVNADRQSKNMLRRSPGSQSSGSYRMGRGEAETEGLSVLKRGISLPGRAKKPVEERADGLLTRFARTQEKLQKNC